jgi:dTDP-4-dehydrorhamnose reductase
MNLNVTKSSQGNPSDPPALWGGIECTINRVGDAYFDQLAYAQHYKRKDDIPKIAPLGIQKIRYPILWEKHRPVQEGPIDWSWISGQLHQLKDAGIEVIAGLVHHGSGPAYTNMLDERFPELLASYAKEVAMQFPQIQYYTPVNEPLTTARFSGLYGLWYPHKRSDEDFIKMLLNELKATVLSMQAIREVNPQAKLVQTEDLGKTYSTPLLRYQATFENHRRWLTYDILMGRLNEQHPLWKYFLKLGITETELEFFIQNPCIPDVFGFNHYVTSERFLDERLHLYAPGTHGGNGRHQYADVEVVRVEVEEETGIKVLLQEAWERYQKPIAITEVHLHCHREEQLRWFQYVWQAASELKASGVAIEGVTAWALLGSTGWNKLLTKPKGTYEPGVFDIRGGYLRPTALANFLQKLTHAPEKVHPTLVEKGWWQRENRFFNAAPVLQMHPDHSNAEKDIAPVMIIGKTGTLGKAFAHICRERSIPFVLLGRQECDISSPEQIQNALDFYKPWAVINTAGFVRLDDAEREQERCFMENCTGAVQLATECRQKGIRFLTFSTDMVYDGAKGKPYVESDPVNPLNKYGWSKARCEEQVLTTYPESLVIRSSSFFGPWDEFNFMHYVIENLSAQKGIMVANDVLVSPTYVPDLVHVALDLLMDEESGIRHLTNKGSITWAGLAQEASRMFRLSNIFINAVPLAEMELEAPRPRYSVLGTEKGWMMPTLDNALRRFAQERKPKVATQLII